MLGLRVLMCQTLRNSMIYGNPPCPLSERAAGYDHIIQTQT